MFPLQDYPFAARPMIVAHRGDVSLGARENSIEALATAIASGAEMTELDVQWSADEQFVCYHDEAHPAMDKPIHQAMFEELKKHHVSALTEILAVGKGKMYFNLEIKEYSDRDPARFMHALVTLLEELKLDGHTLFSSFRADYLREAGWQIPTCILHPDESMREMFAFRADGNPIVFEKPFRRYLPSELMAIARATGYACRIEELTPDSLADIERHNIFLGVYTITSEREFDEAVARGARILVCENPRDFVELRNHRFPAATTMPLA
ncbi:MAG TPA: glycerophosphodiester phosphodiesterase [Candidatus Kapabacteria bacterium]|jgi:glycerophosphoryl diester phosphodiesterase